MVSNAYSYYLTQYGNKVHSKYDTHTRLQLKRTCGKVLKVNSQTPAYKIDFSLAAQRYAIDLKEHARELSYIAKDLSNSDNDEMAFKKSAQSAAPSVISAAYIGDSSSPSVSSFDVYVSQLASNQVNTGNFLVPGKKSLEKGSHSFDLNINNLTYEFEFNVDESESNADIQQKIARLINRSNIGLSAQVLTDELGSTAISIVSDATGVSGIRPTIFTIESENKGLLDTLGINHVSQYPANAVFSINGNEHTSPTNDIIINKEFSLKLHQVTGDNPVTISLRTDGEAMVDSIDELISGYNNLVSVAADHKNDRFSGNEKLRREFSSIARAYQYTLNNSGFSVEDDGSVHVDRDTILAAAENGTLSDVFSGLNEFKKAMQRKAEDISFNPMNYVNNKIIAYKNPHRQFTDPYNLSAYTGMMFNGYC